MSDADWMREALREAALAAELGETPVGAVVVRDGEIVARAHNRVETDRDPCGHAEIRAIRAAAQALGRWRLSDCTLYVTLEPCPMCAGAMLQARIARVVYGAADPRGGCCGSVYRITEDPAFVHYAPADGGILWADCAELLKRFFQSKRRAPQ